MSDLEIRRFVREDRAAVEDLWRECDLLVPWNDPARDIRRKEAVNPQWFLVGEMDGDLIASCMAGYDGHRGRINYLAVHPDHRGRGHGRALVQETERLLTEAGCPKINLEVRTTNHEVIAFYEKLGYTDNACLSLGKRLIPDDVDWPPE